MEWGKYVEMVGVQKTPKLTVSWKLPQGDGEKKEQIVKLTLKLVWSVQHAAEAIGSVRKKGEGVALYVMTTDQKKLRMKSQTPLWRYQVTGKTLQQIVIQPLQSDEGPEEKNIGLVVLNGRRGAKGEVWFSGFSPTLRISEVSHYINHNLHLGFNMKYHGLYIYKTKESGHFLDPKKELGESGVEEMAIVEVKHLPLFELVDKGVTPNVSFVFRDRHKIKDVMRHLCQGLKGEERGSGGDGRQSPPFPSLEELGLMYMPDEETRSWLLPNNTLLNSHIKRGSLILLKYSEGIGSESNVVVGKEKREKVFRTLYVEHSPFGGNLQWRTSPLHPKRMFGEGVLRTVQGVIRVKGGGEKEKGDLHLTNANVVFAKLGLTGYLSYCVAPLQTVGRIDKSSSSYGVELHCKNMVSLKFLLDPKTASRTRFVRLLESLVFPPKPSMCFAYQMKRNFEGRDYGWDLFQGFDKEMVRQVIPESKWRVSFINVAYSMCDTYPNKIIIPASISDGDLEDVFSYRSRGRIPVLTYYHFNGSVMARSSQPMTGLSGRTCLADERLLKAMRDSCQSRTLYIFDLRPRINAMGNQAAGAGFEATGTGTGYEGCKLEFANLENIHVVRKSYAAMNSLAEDRYDDPNWHSSVDATGWLTHVRVLLSAGARLVEVMEHQEASALVHCSDGWDRTSQVCGIAQLMISPQYRTIEGFQLLIDKEWLAFGHKFGQRHGHMDRNADDQQRAQIFLLFIDAVWQLTQQFPCSFEFNSEFLLDLVDASYSCHTGTFLFNCEWERKEAEVRRKTVSLWTVMNLHREKYENVFYVPGTISLIPRLSAEAIEVWKDFFLRMREWDGEKWGMTQELRALQLKSLADGKDKLYHEVLKENEQLKKRLAEFEKKEEEVKEESEGEGKSLEKIDVNVGEDQKSKRICELEAKIHSLEKELRREKRISMLSSQITSSTSFETQISFPSSTSSTSSTPSTSFEDPVNFLGSTEDLLENEESQKRNSFVSLTSPIYYDWAVMSEEDGEGKKKEEEGEEGKERSEDQEIRTEKERGTPSPKENGEIEKEKRENEGEPPKQPGRVWRSEKRKIVGVETRVSPGISPSPIP